MKTIAKLRYLITGKVNINTTVKWRIKIDGFPVAIGAKGPVTIKQRKNGMIIIFSNGKELGSCNAIYFLANYEEAKRD